MSRTPPIGRPPEIRTKPPRTQLAHLTANRVRKGSRPHEGYLPSPRTSRSSAAGVASPKRSARSATTCSSPTTTSFATKSHSGSSVRTGNASATQSSTAPADSNANSKRSATPSRSKSPSRRKQTKPPNPADNPAAYRPAQPPVRTTPAQTRTQLGGFTGQPPRRATLRRQRLQFPG